MAMDTHTPHARAFALPFLRRVPMTSFLTRNARSRTPTPPPPVRCAYIFDWSTLEAILSDEHTGAGGDVTRTPPVTDRQTLRFPTGDWPEDTIRCDIVAAL